MDEQIYFYVCQKCGAEHYLSESCEKVFCPCDGTLVFFGHTTKETGLYREFCKKLSSLEIKNNKFIVKGPS